MDTLVVLTAEESSLVRMVLDRLKIFAPDTVESLEKRFADLNDLSACIDLFPSLYQKQIISREIRTAETLIQSLLTYREGDKLLYLPSKAILGKGFLVAKYHAFAAMTKIVHETDFTDEERKQLRDTTLTLMYTVMAEDVYLSLLEDTSISMEVRREVAAALITLWEHRREQTAATAAPVLDAIWNARDTIAPAFGTMVGTSELLRLTIELDDNWRKFVAEKISEPDVSTALAEFLFGLSYEQIKILKQMVKEHKTHTVGIEDVEAVAGYADLDADYDTRKFYRMYSIRKENARARMRFELEGPHKTLEELFMSFILEKKFKS